jgi:pimeloyl-ACP methyl ester carboxylesterase
MTTRADDCDRTIRLRDGRIMGYADYAAPNGRVVIYTHGGLACRRDVSAAIPVAERNGVRLISVDRPGIGLSDPNPGRTVLDWADDVAELRGHLGIGDFAAMGWSMGGQYALAVGHALRSSVTRVAVLTGALPIADATTFKEMPSIDRTFIRLSEKAPSFARLCLRSMGLVAQVAPDLYGRLAARDLPPADAAVLQAEGFGTFGRMSAEALRHPEGHVEDYLAGMQPWGFAPEDIAVPVDVYGGADDVFLDPGWPAELARRIPNSTLRIRSGGHMMAFHHWDEIFDNLLA